MLKLAIIVPTYNEVNNIPTLVRQVAEVSLAAQDVDTTLIVLDDSSPDGTAEIARTLADEVAADRFSVRVIVREKKEGLGAAYIDGFTRLLAGNDDFDYFLQMDADLSHDPKYISGFIHQARAGTDFVVASRYIPGGGTPDWTLRRRLLSRGGNFYARTILSRKITDYTGGFNMYSGALMKRIQPGSVAAGGYGYLLVLKYRALRSANSFVELPIVFMDRTHGQSKIPRSTMVSSLVLVPRIRARRGR